MDLNCKHDEDYENTISKKPKYMDNIWKTLIFLYSCIIQALSIALSLLDTSSLIVQDIYMFLVYLFASCIIIALLVYLHINRNQTFEEAYKENSESHKLAYSMSGEKVGLYLRFGLVLIGIFSLTYVVLSNAKILTYKSECINIGIITSSTSQCLFFILQAAFILKYHSIIFLRHNRLIKFGLYNIILVNIITWEISCLSKISYTGNLVISNSNCTIKAIESLHLYFLPAVAEYSVIGMAILYEILKRIGRLSLIETSPEYGSTSLIGKMKQSIPGVVIGIIIVFICILFFIFIIIGDKIYHAKWIFFLHNGEEMFLYIFSIIILLITFLKTRRLKFSFTFLQNSIDKNLLYVSCFLSILFSIMISTYCFTFLSDNIRIMRGVTGLVEVFQIVLQTIVIQDSFYRCNNSEEQHQKKPGQNFLAILVGCNFGLWLLKSFQMKNGDIFFNKYQTMIQNHVLFSFFLYATLPLSVLYRYHCSCCFAGAFSKIYQGEVDRFEGILRAVGFENCDQTTKNTPQNQDIQNNRNRDPMLRQRAQTEPLIPKMELIKANDEIPKKRFRRQTIKNLETAKLRILSSQFSQTLVRKKLLSPAFITDSDSDSNSVQDNNIMNDFNLKGLRRYPLLKRHSSNPLDLSSMNDYLYSSARKCTSTKDEGDEKITDYKFQVS